MALTTFCTGRQKPGACENGVSRQGLGMSEYKLTEEILKRSQSQIWGIAKLEWRSSEIYEAEEPETYL